MSEPSILEAKYDYWQELWLKYKDEYLKQFPDGDFKNFMIFCEENYDVDWGYGND